MKTTVSKDLRISAIRLLCTMMIVLLHITQQMSQQHPALSVLSDWLNLGLVMFFSISAFLYSQREITGVGKWYLHRYIEIIVPSLIVGLCTILFFFLRSGLLSTHITGTLLSCIGLQVFLPDSWMFIQLWFLTYILFFYLSVPLIQKIPCRNVPAKKFWALLVATFFALQIGTILIERVTGLTLLSAGILLRMYLPYFVFRRYDINGTEIKPVMYCLTLLSGVAIIVTCWIRYSNISFLPPSIQELVFIYTQTLAGFVLFYWLYQTLGSIKKYSLLLRLSDRFSYEIYLTHCLFIGYSTSIIRKFNYRLSGIIIALILTVISSIVLHYLSKPIKSLLSRKKSKAVQP